MSSSIRVRRRHDGQAIAGKVNFAATKGLFVNFDGTDLTLPSLKKCTGIRGFSLMRDVDTLANLSAALINDQVFPVAAPPIYPAVIGDHVTASRILEAELEGPELVLTSGTGLINASTTVGEKLTTNAGRLSVVQSTEEVIGYLRGHKTPEDSTNTTRILVEFV